jgi:hypothetical protein
MTFCGSPLLRSLLGVKRTWPFALHMSAFDPKRPSLAARSTPSSVLAYVATMPLLSRGGS